MLFWRARALDSNETWWEGARGEAGGQNWTRQLLGQQWRRKKERRGKRRESKRQHVWWKVLSCIGKMTLAEPKGSLLLKPSALQTASVPLPSPYSVFRWVMKHSDRASAQSLAFPQYTSRKKSGFCTEACTFLTLPVHCSFWLQTTEHSVHSSLFLERRLIDSGKVHLSQVGPFGVACRRAERKRGVAVYSL